MTPAAFANLLAAHHVLVPTDNAFQRRARLLQALWREANGLPIGARRNGAPRGSRMPLDFARASLANLVTENARAAVRAELATRATGSGQLIDEDRLLANLLSSQPLCFNLFAELQADLELATRVVRRLWPMRTVQVTAVRFEQSPGRGMAKYTADNSAFDVFVEHTTRTGGRGFLGIEVKYHEDLGVAPAKHRARYDEIARAMGRFHDAHLAMLEKSALLWPLARHARTRSVHCCSFVIDRR